MKVSISIARKSENKGKRWIKVKVTEQNSQSKCFQPRRRAGSWTRGRIFALTAHSISRATQMSTEAVKESEKDLFQPLYRKKYCHASCSLIHAFNVLFSSCKKKKRFVSNVYRTQRESRSTMANFQGKANFLTNKPVCFLQMRKSLNVHQREAFYNYLLYKILPQESRLPKKW